MNKSSKTNWNLITGLVILFINVYWIWDNLYLLYLYHYSSVLFLIMFPDWTLISNAVLGFIGIFIGIKMIRKKMKIKQGILIDLLILAIGSSLKMIMTM